MENIENLFVMEDDENEEFSGAQSALAVIAMIYSLINEEPEMRDEYFADMTRGELKRTLRWAVRFLIHSWTQIAMMNEDDASRYIYHMISVIRNYAENGAFEK